MLININSNKDTPIEWKKVPKPLLILLPTVWLTFFSDLQNSLTFAYFSKFPDFSLSLKKKIFFPDFSLTMGTLYNVGQQRSHGSVEEHLSCEWEVLGSIPDSIISKDIIKMVPDASLLSA